ncbi:MAG: hypothetical protein BM563_06425 [Bacteroidetes bacterium MedPE-SWsnd-G1]|uniref:Riboflavin synthase subunit beta n=1 Tax=Urechidicola vernalis TaxID=3075600 RepID=A0ABU2Y3B1_9FLAO|nr:hypothetical protein [Urechidicola sp. P050]MDT0552182.1 hypothetical protein [Urechidicola sp. P050]OIQ38252.1 MAG: hypothetical protein BM563_06425 [Bacteroidetes bacterium MedPE-SWsnd-G1]
MFGKAFKPRKYYVFDYKPRYYSERKERIANLQNEQEENESIGQIKLTKNNLKNDWVRNTKAAADKGTTRRLALIITILVGIVAYLFELHKLF